MVHKGDLVIIGISVGLAIGIFIACLVFFGIRWYKKHAHLRRCANERSATTLPIRTNGLGTSTDFSASLTNSLSVKGSDHLAKNSQLSWWGHNNKDRLASASGMPKYSYKDVQKGTQNFTTILGQGSFGPVYKATMATSEVVAVKALASNSKQGEKEFQTEVSLLGRLHHRNLVNLVGYCVDKGQHMLIYEFMSNGSLASLLYSQEERVLSWEERLQIALDISHGIEYLHDGAVPPVIHRDLKSANILLDRTMRAKVADFGLSKEEAFDGHNSGLKGTYGYIDPAYISTNKFTMKSDIYSFGVILFELITAIHPHQNLMEYVNLAGMSPDGVDEILDKRLVGEFNVLEARSLAAIAHKCLHKTPRKRPSIGEILQAILKIKQKRLTKEDTMSFAGDDISRMGGDLVIVFQPHRIYDLDKRVRPFVIAFEFYEISQIRGINFDHRLISILLERWRQETHTFYLRVGEITPTLQDVAMLTGLLIDGAPVIGPGGPFDPDELCLCLLGRVPPQTAYRGDNLKLTWLERDFHTPLDEVIWMPLTEALIIASLLACREGSNLWLARIPLYCFDNVEMHFPDRVIWQFGYRSTSQIM